jgi:hypothetical protein
LPAQKEAALFKKSAVKTFVPYAGGVRPVSAMWEPTWLKPASPHPRTGQKFFGYFFLKKYLLAFSKSSASAPVHPPH